ncbi:MAG: hypothetical protein HY369_02705 [Candidatus Aenigmarchaeota archaeon]|nr:hypothetical protein [Candidatus Aenigmarchaeota archaeon]
MKGQLGLMEYIFTAFFLIIIVIALLFFLTGFQITQSVGEKNQGSIDRALLLLKQVSSSPLFVKEQGVLDDAKLTAWLASDTCDQLEELFGPDWFLEVTVLDGTGVVVPCSQATYPQCNHWSLCTQEANALAFDLPVNVYRNVNTILTKDVIPATDLGILKVGVYVE